MDALGSFTPPTFNGRAKRRSRNCCLLVILTLFLTLCALCSLSVYFVRQVGAQGFDDAPLHVLLLIDNSNSMYEKGGVGSDPDRLRIEAAHLTIWA